MYVFTLSTSRVNQFTSGLARNSKSCLNVNYFSTSSRVLGPARIAIVGTGPSGFYTAKYLLKEDPQVSVDLIDSLPTPFGMFMHLTVVF